MNQDYIISVITPFYRGNKYIEQLFCVINKNYQKLRETFSNAKIELIIFITKFFRRKKRISQRKRL